MMLNLSRLTSLKVRHKLGLIVGLLAIPILVQSFLLFTDERAKLVFSQAESRGLYYLAPLREIIQEVAKHRAHSADYHRGDKAAANRMREQAMVVDALVAKQDAEEEKYGKQFQTAQEWAKIRKEWASLKDEAKDLDGELSFKRHTDLVQSMLDLNTHILTVSNLILDPIAETYFLIDISANRLPELFERLGQLRAKARQALAKETLVVEDEIQLAESIALVRDRMGAIDSEFDLGLKDDPRLKALSEPALKSFDTAVDRVVEEIEGISLEAIQQQKLKLTADEVFEKVTKAIELGAVFAKVIDPELQKLLDKRVRGNLVHMIAFVGGGLLIALLAGAFAYVTVRAVTQPLGKLAEVARKIASGDKTARAQLVTRDEIGELAMQFDMMLDQQVALNNKITQENEQLNQSVLALLQGVAKLAQRDLTSKVVVAEDVTGAVSDALNLLASETAKVLSQVNDVARDVADVSEQVKNQSDSVLGMSRSGRREVQEAAQELTEASKQMQAVAKLAQSCNEAAQEAIGTTRTALESVGATGDSIGTIRDTVRETEKRIKRLGERSQEISGVVTLINTISERTHILALNAAMHAASAGEAGRGFAVVAGEVQRLAENAREATSQISSLVHNIQVETADTVDKMNDVITQVVQGGKLAEQAGQQMRDTEEKTNHLVQMVGQIAQSSAEQARATEAVRGRTERVEKSAEITGNELEQQAKNTDALVDYAKRLVDSVSVFRLPEAATKRAA